MELFTFCKSCRDEFIIASKVHARNELEDEIGLNFKKQCPKCLSTQEYHVNDIKARASKKYLILVSIFAFLIGPGTAIILWNVGWWSSISLVLPLIIIGFYQKNQQASASTFNRYMLKR